MRPADNIRESFRKLHFPTSAELDEKIREEISRVSGQTNENKPAESKPVIWRRIMLIKLKYKVAALLGCVILVSAAAAITVPGVYNTIRTFISAFDEKDIGTLVELTDPMYAVHHQVLDLKNVLTDHRLELVGLYADDSNAIAFTTDVIVVDTVYDEGYIQGPLVITLTKKDNMWLVIDIDLENEETVKTELERFLMYHPDAVEININ